MADRLNWLIMGAGAIGTYVGAALILHGQNVVFLEQPEAAANLKQYGLRFSIAGQDHRLLHPDIYTSLPQVLELGIFDVAVLALKSFDTQTVLEEIRPHASSFPPVLCLQNGVENEPALEVVLGTNKVIAGTVTSSVLRRNVGDIVLERQRGVGVAAGHALSVKIAGALNEAGLNARLYSSAAGMKWSKMLTNLLANASSAILNMTPGQVLSEPSLYQIEVAQIREALAVMRALHLRPTNLPGTPVVAFAWAIRYLPPSFSKPFIARIAGGGRGQKMPSFHIDLYAGRGKSEVDYLNGAVWRIGSSVHVYTPVNLWLNQTLMSLVKGERPVQEYAQQALKYVKDLGAFINEYRR